MKTLLLFMTLFVGSLAIPSNAEAKYTMDWGRGKGFNKKLCEALGGEFSGGSCSSCDAHCSWGSITGDYKCIKKKCGHLPVNKAKSCVKKIVRRCVAKVKKDPKSVGPNKGKVKGRNKGKVKGRK